MLSIVNEIDPLIFCCVCFVCDTNYVFPTIFAREYNEIRGLDPSLVVHMLNVETGTKPMAQPDRVFHIDIEAHII